MAPGSQRTSQPTSTAVRPLSSSVPNASAQSGLDAPRAPSASLGSVETPAQSAALSASAEPVTSGVQPQLNKALAVSSTVSAVLPWAPQPAALGKSVNATTSTAVLTALPTGVRAVDLIAQVSPGATSNPRIIGLQCQGTNSDLATQSAAFVATPAASAVQRFGTAATLTEKAQRFEVGSTDKLPAGSPPRCENLVFPGASGLREGETFWHAIEMWTDDWANSTDDQLVLQWHQDDARLSQNPYFALLLKGKTLRAEMRSNANLLSTKASNTVFSSPAIAWTPKQWNSIVIQGRISPNPALSPFVRIWINGVLAINRTEPLGYYLAGNATYYVKWGIYKWTDGNPWDAKYPTRSVMVRNMLLVRDPTARYTATSIGSALKCPSCNTAAN